MQCEAAFERALDAPQADTPTRAAVHVGRLLLRPDTTRTSGLGQMSCQLFGIPAEWRTLYLSSDDK